MHTYDAMFHFISDITPSLFLFHFISSKIIYNVNSVCIYFVFTCKLQKVEMSEAMVQALAHLTIIANESTLIV